MYRIYKFCISLLFIVILLVVCSCKSNNNYLSVNKELKYCDSQINRTIKVLRESNNGSIDYTMMPRNIPDSLSNWQCNSVYNDWCAGFWPGILWYDYEITGNNDIKKEASKFTNSLKFLSKIPAIDHALGFMVFCSYGNGYRLTKDENFKKILLASADTLATLYNPMVGTILSWPRNKKLFGGHNTIIDSMINLELLFWAAKNGGENHKYLYDIAVNHADKTMKCHFRPDYTSYHVAVYDTISGDFIKGVTHHGYNDNSMWSRGQAWAIYGFTMVYRETRNVKYLDFVQKITDIYLKSLPKDLIPYWDFSAPNIPNASRDASAAAIVASALIELSTYLPYSKGRMYLSKAEQMLESLSSSTYQCGKNKPAFLNHSTGRHPSGNEIDASIIYADYYYIESLIRLNNLQLQKKLID